MREDVERRFLELVEPDELLEAVRELVARELGDAWSTRRVRVERLDDPRVLESLLGRAPLGGVRREQVFDKAQRVPRDVAPVFRGE